MRATMRITWLLLSLSFLFYSVDSQGVPTQGPDSVSTVPSAVQNGGSASGNDPSTDAKTRTNAATTGTAGALPTDMASSTAQAQAQAPTPRRPTAAVTAPASTTGAPSKPTDKPASTQPQATTVPSNPTVHPNSFSNPPHTAAKEATTAAPTQGPFKTMAPATTADSRGSSVAPPSAATSQTPAASVPLQTSGTVAPSGPPTNHGNVGTTKITKPPTDATMLQHQHTAHTPVTSNTSSQENSHQGTAGTTVTVPSRGQTTSGSPEPPGNTGTTSTPPSLTSAGSHAAVTVGTRAGTTSPPTPTTTTTTTTTTTNAAVPSKTLSYSLNSGHETEEEKDLVGVCKRLMVNLQDGNCTLTWRHHNGKIQFDSVEINGKVKTSLANQYYDEITKKPTDNKTLIAILASCGALLIMIVLLAVCASHHRKPYNENQQHLTEELHTVENGYHDNPTLEVMEVQPEMQEKKMALNGEFNDSWIVPIDNLLKEDIPDEEDTHL